MILTGWHIEGYGVFADWTVRGLCPGVTVLHGPNEAGKSTLLSFLRGALFGFTPKNGRIPALSGGRHGGRVFLADEAGGEWVLERWVGKPGFTLTRPDGGPGDEADLAALFHHADEILFRSVFAFDLTDLQDLKSLDDETGRARFFSAGISGAGISADRVLKDFSKEIEELFKPGGKNPALNQTLKKLKELDKERKARAEEARGYPALRAERQAAAERVEAVRQARDEALRRVERLGLLVELKPFAESLAAAEARLAGLRVPEGLPPDAGARYEAALEKRREAVAALLPLESELAALREEIATLSADPALLAAAPRLLELRETLPLQAAKAQAARDAAQRAGLLRQRLESQLRELGGAWTLERARTADTGIERRKEVRDFAARLAEAARALRESDGELTGLENERAALGEIHEAASQPSSELRRALAVLRDALADWRAQAALQAATPPPSAPQSGPRLAPLLLAVAAIALTGGLAAFFAGEAYRLPAGALALLGLGVLAARLLLGLRRSEPAPATAKAPPEGLARAAEAVRHAAVAARVADPFAPGALALAEEQLEKAAEAERRREQAAGLRRRGELAEQRRAQAQTLLDSLEKDWAALASRLLSLPEGGAVPAPETALELLDAAARVMETDAALAEAEATLAAAQAALAAWDDEAASALAALDGFAAPGEPPPEALRRASQAAQDAQAAKTRADALAQRIDTLLRDQRKGEQTRRAAEDAVAELFSRAGAADEAGFFAVVAAQAEKARLTGAAERDRAVLRSRLGESAADQRLLEELRGGDLALQRAELSLAREEGERLARQFEADNRALGGLDEQLVRLERSTDLLDCELRAQAERAEGEALALRWRTLALARALLGRTLAAYAEERQPQVLAQASGFFASCTRGRYERILQVPGREEVRVLRADGAALAVDALSRGTREDLYVCLRLALADQFAQRSGRLPFVADDVFVNFDPQRAEAALATLADFASRHQALLFTCHPETVARVQRVAPHARLLPLPGRTPAA